MTIAEQVQQIIDKRQQRLPAIQECIAKQHLLLSALKDLENVRSEILDDNGNIIPGNRYMAILNENPMLAAELIALDIRTTQNSIWNCINTLDEYRRRAERQRVHISVIGRARIGKSATLQSFSGLDSRVIPSFDSTDCTGATCIIHNVPGSPVRAKLTFKSREDMRRLAQNYLDDIIPDESRRIRLGDMSEIAALDMEDVRRRMPEGSGKGILLNPLGNLVKHYDQWAPYAGRKDVLVLTDEDEIITFVAQNNGLRTSDPRRVEYFRYLTVDTCNIDCSFPEQDIGAVTLIDTIGIGDNQMGISEKMLRTVKEESDAAIFLMMPTDGTSKGVADYITQIYESIYRSCSDRDMDKWLFYMLNHIPQTTNSVKKNTDECHDARHTILSTGWHGHEPCIVNARDADACRSFLKHLLSELLQNLDSVDRLYHDRAAEALRNAQTAYSKLSADLGRLVGSCVGKDNLNFIVGQCEQFQETIVRTMRSMADQWKAVRDEPCAKVFNHAEEILFDMRQGSMVPGIDTIADRLLGEQNWTLMGEYMNNIRNEISRRFLDADVVLHTQIDEMKEAIAREMCHTLGFSRIYPMRSDISCRQWLQEFTDFSLRAAGSYPGITLALDTLQNFEFSVKNFLTYEIRSGLSLLDPNETQTPVLSLPNRRQTAMSMRTSLTRMTVDTAAQIHASMRELCIRPNRAIYAEVSDFVDRMIYMQGIREEWRSFLLANANALWAGQIQNNLKMNQLEKNWTDLINRIRNTDMNDAFHIKEVN